METRRFIIASSNKNAVVKQLDKMNKRAMRLSLPEITYTFDKSFINDMGHLMIPVDVSGPIFVNYEDWEFVATLQHLPTGENIVRTILQDAELPIHYRNNGSICEHCRVNRYRKDTYVVRHTINKQYMQVGSSCIKDFLGGNSPDNILQRANLAGEIISFLSNNGSFGLTNEPTYLLSEVLSKTSALISMHGWLSKSRAYEMGGKSTASRLQDSLEKNAPMIKVSEFDKNKAEEAVMWAENLSEEEVEKSDYLYNIRAIARAGVVEWRTMGFATSIISAFDKDQESKKIQVISNYVGSVKERTSFTLQLKNKFQYNGSYGVTYKYIFNDECGNVIVWSASNPQDFVVNHKYMLRGTIKAHSEYKGVKQTIINRCELLCELGE